MVYPRLVASEHRDDYTPQRLASGVPEVDALLGGGIDRGTSTLIMGPAGSGKSALCTQYVTAAAERGENAAVFIFDESRGTLFVRSQALKMGLAEHVASGRVTLQQIDPAEIPPGEFVHLVREAVEKRHISVLVIDSLNGYMNAMPEEHFLIIQMHELLTYLGQKGVATILVVAQHGLLGQSMLSPVDVSYLADCVILLRYFEHEGQIHKAISIMKKRSGPHESSIRAYGMNGDGLHIGEPLDRYHGVLTGVPTLGRTLSEAAG